MRNKEVKTEKFGKGLIYPLLSDFKQNSVVTQNW